MNTEAYKPTTSLGNAVDLFYLNDHFNNQSITLAMLHQEIVYNLGDWFDKKDMNEKFSTKNHTTWTTNLHTKHFDRFLHFFRPICHRAKPS